ncbi:type II secretion system secretin GspD [Azospirillum sp.]|uniref:type II secretion system secretin GspD n=1 Tax=Azospirillum sp. TaxID=34012 RepID=UPI002D321F75|nr:type II secretion system secretin GspD [Azospirillum sp.]HYD68351.1 type II secretion system secretin GspD [Azospirillum sp.]
MKITGSVFLGLAIPLLMMGCARPSKLPAASAIEGGAVPQASRPLTAMGAPSPIELAAPGSAKSRREAPVLLPGTGVFTATPVPGGPPGVLVNADEVSVNFVNADVKDVVRGIIDATVRKPVVIDPKVQGQITVQTSRPIPCDDALLLLENALRVNGAALVENAGSYAVVLLQDAPKAAQLRLNIPEHERAQGFGVQVVPLRHVSAPEMLKILQPFLPAERILKADASRPLLIVAGTRQEIATLEDLVASFDVDWLRGMSFGMFTLEAAKPTDLSKELASLLGSDDGPMSGMLRFVPVDRLNALLVIAQKPDLLKTVQGWIDRLDRSRGFDTPRVFVYYVQNGNAEGLAGTLSEMFSPGRSGGGGAMGAQVAPGLSPTELGGRGSGLGRSGAGGGFGGGIGGGFNSHGGRGFGGAPSSGSRSGSSFTGVSGPGGFPSSAFPAQRPALLPISDPVIAPGALPDLGAAGRQAPGSVPVLPPPGSFAAEPAPPTPEVRVIADRDKNAIVIMATPRDYDMVQDALRRLDVAPFQVLVEATIAEVTLNDDLKYGVEWFFKSGNHQLTLSDPRTGLVSPLAGFSYLFDTANARVVLNALSAVTNVNVISSPHLLVLDNQSARLQVGDQVPIATQSAVSVLNPDSPIVNSITLKDTGVILEVRPRIGAGGRVFMEIYQEVSDVVPTRTSGIDSPTIQQRRVHSTVAVQDGQSVALGGLIRDGRNGGKSGVPILSDIPILGHLFSTTEERQQRTELLVMLTPRVIRSSAEAQEATDELRRRLRAIDPRARIR